MTCQPADLSTAAAGAVSSGLSCGALSCAALSGEASAGVPSALAATPSPGGACPLASAPGAGWLLLPLLATLPSPLPEVGGCACHRGSAQVLTASSRAMAWLPSWWQVA